MQRHWKALTCTSLLIASAACTGGTRPSPGLPVPPMSSPLMQPWATQPDAGPSFVEISGAGGSQFSQIASDEAGGEWFYDRAHNPPSIVRLDETSHQKLFFQTKYDLDGFALGSDKKAMWFTGANDSGTINIIGNVSLQSPYVFRIAKLKHEAHRLTAGPLHSMWYTSGNYIGRFDPKTHVVTLFTVPQECDSTQDIAAGSDGGLWFSAYTAEQALCRFDPTTHHFSSYPTNHHRPFWLTSGPNDSIWFSEDGLEIGSFDIATHHFSYVNAYIPGGVYIRDIVTRKGQLWIPYAGGYVGRYDPASYHFDVYTIPHPSSAPDTMALGADNQLWITEDNANRILLLCPGLGSKACAAK